MKHFFISFIFLALTVISKSQDYIPFPLDSTIWFSSFTQCDELYNNCFVTETGHYYTNGDTLINGHSMSKITANSYAGPTFWNEIPLTDYVGAIREDSTRVYFVPWYQEQEMLLFDFSLEIGDEVQVFAGGWEPNLLVEDVTYEDFNGITRKVIHFSDGRWIEGIGSDRGLLMEITPNVSGYFTYQECVKVGNEVIFDHEEGELNCSLLSVENPEREISIYPNPSNGVIEIEGLNEFFAIEVIDQQGRLVLSKTNDIQTRSRLDLSELKSGLFILRIHFEDFVSSHRIIIE
jgi:hypothetical protein